MHNKPREKSIKFFPTISYEALDSIPLYLYMGEDDLEALYEREVTRNDAMPRALVIGDDSDNRKSVEVRFRGNSSRYL
ncbi:hypothetical protein [Natranaerovirga hydrolytica]|uniref:hypothetical protein n=1 Tax=Natranaerovirga hydrolytica TaxID=680378 RepID=UPI00104DC5A3|nr:hypothetical protein [Natranaerovirga hydrolytica]